MRKQLLKWIPLEALKNISYISLGKFFTYSGGLFYGIFGAYLLGASGFGQLVLIMATVQTFSLLFQFNLYSPLVKLISERLAGKSTVRNRDIIRVAFLSQAVGGVLFSLLFFLFLWFAAPDTELFGDWQTALGWFALSELLQLLRKPLSAVIIAYEKFGWKSFYSLLYSLCRDYLVVIFMYTGGVQGACFGYFIGELIILAASTGMVLSIWGKRVFRLLLEGLEDSGKITMLIFKNSRSNYLAHVFNKGYNELQKIILGLLVSPAGAGYFTIGLKFQKFFTFSNSTLKTYLFPRFIKKWNSSRAEFFYTLRKYFLLLGPANLLLALFLAAAAPWLVPLLFSAEFIPSIPLVWILSPGFVIKYLLGIFKEMTFVLGCQRELVKFGFLEFVIGLPLTVLLVGQLGYIGAAWAHTVVILLMGLYQVRFFHLKFGWSWLYRSREID